MAMRIGLPAQTVGTVVQSRFQRQCEHLSPSPRPSCCRQIATSAKTGCALSTAVAASLVVFSARGRHGRGKRPQNCQKARQFLRTTSAGTVRHAICSAAEVVEGQETIIEAVRSLPQGGDVQSVEEVTPGPGLQNRHLRLNCSGGASFLAKVSSGDDSMFAGERAGLEALEKAAQGTDIVVPHPHAHGLLPRNQGSFLVLDYLHFIPFGPSIPTVLESLGRGLALMHTKSVHGIVAARYGFIGQQTYLGGFPQDNSSNPDFADFFVEQRLRPQLERACLKFQHRYGTSNESITAVARLYEKVLTRSRELLMPVRHCQPSLLHGDLWTGNTGATQDRCPIVVDPACWYGHAEFDLALSALFGRFGPRFYDAYFEVLPAVDGFAERQHVYLLYHMLNQANLHGAGFGRGGTAEKPGGYLEQAIAVMERLVA